MAVDYGNEHPEIDFLNEEIFFVFERNDSGMVRVGGHRPIDHDKNEQIRAMMNQCCCGEEGCEG
jgi:hypothetical protein